MFDNTDIIGDYKGTVKNKVITALLQSYLDTLDYDGMKSILREAELLELKDMRDVDPNGYIDFFSFKKLISAQNCLLYDSNDLLHEIGRKFAFYLFPFGKNFGEIISEINELINTDWKVSIIKQEDYSVIIRVNKCVFCSEIGVSCDLFKGFLINSLEKTLPTDFQVIQVSTKENVSDPNHNSFILKLTIEKTFKT
jgi:predicted hydrocarbon binding protein